MDRCHLCGSLDILDGDESYLECQPSHGEPCGKLRLLNKPIFHTKTVLESLLNQRRQLRSKFNDKSVIHRLPVEVASLVFEFYVNPRGKTTEQKQDCSPLTLGAVCRTWRQVAWSTPRIWTYLSFGFGSGIRETHIQLAIEWLGRSGQLPLTIYLYHDPKTVVFIRNLAYLLIEAINNCSSRWYSLTLDVFPTLLSRFSDSHGASILRYLDIKSNQPIHIGITKARPNFVRFNGYPTCLVFKWDKVTRLSITNILVDEIFHIIRQAPQLTECDLDLSFTWRGFPIIEDHILIPIHHAQIKYINIEFAGEPMGSFFNNITLPGLTDLTCQLSGYKMSTQILLSFLERSSCRLEHFGLNDTLVLSEEIVQIITAIPSVTSLDLIDLDTHPTHSLVLFFHLLSTHLPTTYIETVWKRMMPDPVLPLLKKFSLSSNIVIPGEIVPWELIPRFFTPFTEMEGASRRPLESLDITWKRWWKPGEPMRYIYKETLSQLLDLIEQGVSIRLQAKNPSGAVDDLIKFEREVRRIRYH